jgi:hypothetical protein
MDKNELFYRTIKKLEESGLLNSIVLVGSWCLDFYRNDMNNSPFIPAVKTNDIDFLIPKSPKVKKSVNIPNLLEGLGFVTEFDYTTGMTIFLHPELKIEFLTVLGRGDDHICKFDNLGVSAQELPFMNIALNFNYKTTLNGVTITVPEPEAFALHKMLVVDRRKDIDKREKDLETIVGIFEEIEEDEKRIERVIEIFEKLPKKQQRTILNIVDKYKIHTPLRSTL